MTATEIDSTVFRHIFSSEPMRQVFSDENRVQCYLGSSERKEATHGTRREVRN
jgi:hypothetical protein